VKGPDPGFHFGPFRVDRTRHVIWKGDQLLPVGGRAVDLLIALADRPGDVLNLDTSALAGPVLVTTTDRSPSTPGSANSLAPGVDFSPVEFAAIEDLNLVDRGRLTEAEMGDVFLRGTNLPETFRFAPVHSDMARVQIGEANHLLTIVGRAIVDALGGNDLINTGSAADVLIGGAGDDILAGNGGDDRYEFRLGDGQDAIDEAGAAGAAGDVIRFGPDILPGRIRFLQTGPTDLVIGIAGTQDRLTLKNMFRAAAGGVDYGAERFESADG